VFGAPQVHLKVPLNQQKLLGIGASSALGHDHLSAQVDDELRDVTEIERSGTRLIEARCQYGFPDSTELLHSSKYSERTEEDSTGKGQTLEVPALSPRGDMPLTR
jgi:hypothetical protein